MSPRRHTLVTSTMILLTGCYAGPTGGPASYDSIGHTQGWSDPDIVEPGEGVEPGLTVDDEDADPAGIVAPTGAGTRALSPDCGDGRLQAGEECDDGNASNHDACRMDCLANRCGDGWVQDGVEECDDASETDAGDCVECHPAFCGDGHVQVGVERCDDGADDGAIGRCAADCGAGPQGCLDGSAEQHFGASMQGCGGRLRFEDRAYACQPGWHVCSATEWLERSDGQVAGLHYWTADVLEYASGGWQTTGAPTQAARCDVRRTASDQPRACRGDVATMPHSPMRVCAFSGADALGNECALAECSFEGRAQVTSFGGCGEVATAGALCCR